MMIAVAHYGLELLWRESADRRAAIIAVLDRAGRECERARRLRNEIRDLIKQSANARTNWKAEAQEPRAADLQAVGNSQATADVIGNNLVRRQVAEHFRSLPAFSTPNEIPEHLQSLLEKLHSAGLRQSR